MKKILRISLIAFGVLLVVLAAAILIGLPLLKPKIETAVNKAIADNVNAQVNGVKEENLDLSLFANFPNLTVGISNISVVNLAPFEGDTLASIGLFEIEVNLSSIISGDYVVNGITLNEPRIFVKVLKDGSANYDIAKMDSSAVEDPTDTTQQTNSNLGIKINHWAINEGHFVYNDASLDVNTEIHGFNHKGSGDFTLSEFDLITSTTIQDIVLDYGGTRYLGGQSMGIDLTTQIKMDEALHVVIKENTLKLSNMAISAQGTYDYAFESGESDVDITFQSIESGFKDLLSLIPPAFMTGFESLKADGTFAFDGKVVGKVTETEIPGFMLGLKVNNGMFQYPDLPKAVKDINIDMTIDALTEGMDNMTVDIKQFGLALGNAPINGKLMIKGPLASATDIYTKADISAKINLEEFADIVPMEGYVFKGDFAFNCKADGKYDTLGQIPTIDLLLEMNNGYVEAPDAPYPIEQINVRTVVKNQTGKMEDLDVNVEKASFVMNQEPFEADGNVHGLTNMSWVFNVKGGIDLGIVSKYYQDPAMTLRGKIKADIQTKGDLEKLYAGKYDQLPTSGSAEIKDFAYGSTDYFPKDITTVDITFAKATFTPQSINITECKGKTGKSDFTATGSISNYLGYTFADDILVGRMNINSNYFDIDQWMSYESEEAPAGQNTPAPTETTEVNMEEMAIPKNIDFSAGTKIKKATYTGTSMTDINGVVALKDGIAFLKLLQFNSLGGTFVMDGAYDTRNPQVPKFNGKMKIASLSFQNAYKTFNSVQQMAPAAQDITGTFGSDMAISGNIGSDLFPIFESMTGDMLLNIDDAAVKGNKVFKKIADQIGNQKFANPTLDDVKAKMKIEDGKLLIAKTPMKISGYPSTFEGTVGVDQKMNLQLNMVIPTADMGQQGKTYEQFTGEKTMNIALPITGSVTNPSVDAGAVVRQLIADATKKGATKQLDNLKKGLGDMLKDDNKSTEEKKEDVKKKAEDLLKNPFGKKK